ncbi:MAG: amidohydrolase [Acidobacteria bacterium]|nr:MAG: amidohydrolase [Acidobacteriota bacterium]
MVIDFHVHCFPDILAAKAIPLLSESSGIAPCTDGTISGLKQSMKRAGISCSVIQSIATKPGQTQSANNWAASVQGNGILAFGTIHPQLEQWEEEADRIKSLGLRGVKFHPDYQDFFVDAAAMMPVYEKLAKLDLIILFHAGVDVGLPAPYHCTPDRLARVVEALPGARLVAAHMGGYRYWDEVERYLVGRDLFFDTSYALGHINPKQFFRILDNHGAHRCLFGSDTPWADQAKEIEKIAEIDLKPGVRYAVLEGNARKLLHLENEP